MKKTQLFSLLLLLIINISLVAQNKQNAFKKIKTIKVNYITNELDLTPKEAKEFWPIYNAFEKEKRQIRTTELKAIKAKLKSFNTVAEIPENEALLLQSRYFNLEEKMLDNKRKHFEQLIKVIGIHKVLKLHNTEKTFNNKLLKELRKKHKKN